MPSAATDTARHGRSLASRGRTRIIAPGLVLALLVGIGALLLSRAVPALSPALVAIALGAVAVNVGVLPPSLAPGLDVAARPVLRVGIVLLGLQLALGDVIALGPGALALIVAVVAGGLGAGILIGRALRLPAAQTLLVACGFSICGAAAVAAVAGSLRIPPGTGEPGDAQNDAADRIETQTATAVALVVVCGTLMIPLLPLGASLLGLDEHSAGIWAGASVHEVAQVVAAGDILGPEALRIAVLVKLGRVLLLAPVIAALARRGDGAARAGATRPPLVPWFVVAFLAAVLVRSLGVLPVPVLQAARPVQVVCLTAAMFALGTGVRGRLLARMGARTAVLAVAVTLVVAGLGLAGAVLIA